MSGFVETAHPRERTGRFTDKTQSAPEAPLHVDAADRIRQDAPIGARTAHLYYDPEAHALLFSRYADRNGRGIPTGGPTPVIFERDTANAFADFDADPDFTITDEDGDITITVALED
jgi:hypothetical protein